MFNVFSLFQFWIFPWIKIDVNQRRKPEFQMILRQFINNPAFEKET